MKIKSFKEWDDINSNTKINEVGNQPLPIEWKQTTDNGFHTLTGIFFVDEQPFDISVSPLDGNTSTVYQFKFYRNGHTHMFNDIKYSFKVLSTLKHALEHAIKELNPDILVFASVDDSAARKSIYKTMAGYISTKFRYLDITRNDDLQQMGLLGDNIFGIYRNEEVLQNAIKDSGL